MMSRYVETYSAIIAQYLAPVYIRFPQNDFERNVIKTKFFQHYEFPGILGIIDCTQVAITAVSLQTENRYVNRKGFHSINTQIVCDADMTITNINARFPGATHDSFIFNGSILNTHLEQVFEQNPQTLNFLLGKRRLITFLHIFYLNSNVLFLIGDSAYRLLPWLLKIYDGNNLNEVQRNFNRRLIAVRQLIERCIGVLKMRFRCILGERKLRYNPTKVGQIIYSCATLHNYLIANRFNVLEGIDHQILENLMRPRNVNNFHLHQNERQVAETRRNQLANFFHNNVQ